MDIANKVFPASASVSCEVPTAEVQFLSEATKSLTKNSTNHREKITAVGESPASLKRTRGNVGGQKKDQENAKTTSAVADDGQQSRKKVKMEKDLEMESILSSPCLSRFSSETSSIPSIMTHTGAKGNTTIDRNTRSKVDYGDLHGTLYGAHVFILC